MVKEMSDGELAVKYALENAIRKVLRMAERAKDKGEIVEKLELMLGEEHSHGSEG